MGFLRVGKGSFSWFKVPYWGFLIKGLWVYLKSNDVDCYDYVFNVCLLFIVAF